MTNDDDGKVGSITLMSRLMTCVGGLFLYKVFRDTGRRESALRNCVEGAVKSALITGTIGVAGLLIAAAVHVATTVPRSAACVTCGLALCGLAYFLLAYRKSMNERRERKSLAAAKRRDDAAWLVRYLETDHSLLTQAERDDVAGKLDRVDGIDAFRNQLDDEYRLRLIGMIQPRELVCWLDELTDVQKAARPSEWDMRRKAQSDAQRLINAKNKAARLAANPPVQPTQGRIEARERAKLAKRDAAAKLKAERDAEYEETLRRKGAAAKAAYRKGWSTS